MSQGLISFSLWGKNPVYCVGALRNAEIAAEVYPGWMCRFYLGRSVPDSTRDALAALPNTELIEKSEQGDWRAMLWRFTPAFATDGIVIVRDADSRVNARERVAVDAWLASDYNFHIMRDHPHHGAPILGGMWGAKNGLLRGLQSQFESYSSRDHYQTDQEFLCSIVFPLVQNQSLVHDEVRSNHPFPGPRHKLEFVGQPFDQNDRPLNPEHERLLARALRRRR